MYVAIDRFADPNYHHLIKVMNSCLHAATETKCYCATIQVLLLCKFILYINDVTNILNNSLSVFPLIATYIYIYLYIWKLDKFIRHNFSATLSFHIRWKLRVTEKLSYWFVQLSDIPRSANASSTIPQGYTTIKIYFIYIYIYIYIYINRETMLSSLQAYKRGTML